MSRNVSRYLQAIGAVLTAVVLAFPFASPAQADPGQWDPTLPKILSAGARVTRSPWPTPRCR